MKEADKDWVMVRMVGGGVFLLVPAHPGSPGQRAVKRLLLCSVLTVDCYLLVCAVDAAGLAARVR